MADLHNLDAEINESYDVAEFPEQHAEGEDWDTSNAERVDALLTPAAPNDEEEEEVDRLDLEDIAQTTTDELMYTGLYKAWVQERRSPELLQFPTDIVDGMREEIADLEEVDTGNLNLDGLLESILSIDKERVKFLVADLLKCRLEKIQTYPGWMASKVDRMSPHERNFWAKYKDLQQTHILTNVMLPDKEDWRNLESDSPDLSHSFCFAECRETVIINGETAMQGSRRIVRYAHVREMIEKGQVVLV